MLGAAVTYLGSASGHSPAGLSALASPARAVCVDRRTALFPFVRSSYGPVGGIDGVGLGGLSSGAGVCLIVLMAQTWMPSTTKAGVCPARCDGRARFSLECERRARRGVAGVWWSGSWCAIPSRGIVGKGGCRWRRGGLLRRWGLG